MAQINDDLNKTLGGLGFTGALPNKVHSHLGSLGHTGAMNDRLSKEGGFKGYTEGLLSRREAYDFDGIDDFISFAPKTITGDFEIEVEVEGGVFASDAIVGKSDTSNDHIRINTNTNVRFHLGGQVALVSLSSPLPSSGLFVLTLSRVGNVVRVQTGTGVDDSDTLATVDACTFDVIAQKGNSFFFAGKMLNFKLTDPTTPANDFFMAIDDGFAANPTIATGGTANNFNEERWGTL